MLGLIDIAPAVATVAVQNASVAVHGISATGLAHLLNRFPELRKLMTGQEVETDQLMAIGGDAVAAIIAAGCGYPCPWRIRKSLWPHRGQTAAMVLPSPSVARSACGLQPPLQLGLQDAVFGGQIFVPRQQLLVHRPVTQARMRAKRTTAPCPARPPTLVSLKRRRHRYSGRENYEFAMDSSQDCPRRSILATIYEFAMDRDKSYGPAFRHRVRAMGITEVITAPRSPWQNPYAERLIGSIRRECLDHVIIFNERHLRRVLSRYFQYHHETRTHLSLGKDCPQPRPIQSPSAGNIIVFPEVGGLHHRYERRAA